MAGRVAGLYTDADPERRGISLATGMSLDRLPDERFETLDVILRPRKDTAESYYEEGAEVFGGELRFENVPVIWIDQADE